MEILPYEDWMRPQVIQLFVDEYGVNYSTFEELFVHFYESSFQKGKSIRIVALDGQTVGGFQSFFYWPLSQNGQEIEAWQSGNSLVHPNYRGKGLFAKMLDYIHLPESGFHAEMLLGFPVEMSYNSFIRNKWNNLFNLQWYVKTGSPLLSLLRYNDTSICEAMKDRQPASFHIHDESLRVSQTLDFDNYRFKYQNSNIGRLILNQSGVSCFIEFKIQLRKKIIRELVIGKILFNHPEQKEVCDKLFRAALNKLNKEHRPTLFSFAGNSQHAQTAALMENTGFRPIDKHIYFVTKGLESKKYSDASLWDIQRADIDTW